MKLIKEVMYRCPYCLSYVYVQDKYWCDVCSRLFDKSTLEEVEDE